MTKVQEKTVKGLASFANNVGKLSIGRSTRLIREYSDGTSRVLAKVTCDTVGQRPRLFTVSSNGVLPSGTGYTYRKVMENIIDYTML